MPNGRLGNLGGREAGRSRTDTILASNFDILVQRRDPSISYRLAGNHIHRQGHGSDLVVRTKSITCADHNLS